MPELSNMLSFSEVRTLQSFLKLKIELLIEMQPTVADEQISDRLNREILEAAESLRILNGEVELQEARRLPDDFDLAFEKYRMGYIGSKFFKPGMRPPIHMEIE